MLRTIYISFSLPLSWSHGAAPRSEIDTQQKNGKRVLRQMEDKNKTEEQNYIDFSQDRKHSVPRAARLPQGNHNLLPNE